MSVYKTEGSLRLVDSAKAEENLLYQNEVDVCIPDGCEYVLSQGHTSLLITIGADNALAAIENGFPCLAMKDDTAWAMEVSGEALSKESSINPMIVEVVHRYSIQNILIVCESQICDDDGIIENIKTFAEALRFQIIDVAVGVTFCPERKEKDEHGYILHNQGLKQWFQTEDVSTVIGTLNQHIDSTVKTYTGVRSIGIQTFLNAKIQPRKKLLGDWLLYKSLSIIYAERGLGKTQLALEIAMAVATGTDCLGWKSHGAEGVLYVDGEMSGHDMKVRLSNIISSKKLTDNNINFELITPETSPWLPDLSTKDGRQLISNIVGQKKIKLVIIDNISSLCRSHEYSENDAISWKDIQEWAIDMRSQGCSIIFIHHAGKNGQQRGTSKREDVMDIVIGLKPIKDDAANDDVGARFDIVFEKTRHSFGSAVKPIRAELHTSIDGIRTWDISDPTIDKNMIEVSKLRLEGKSYREIADILNISKSTAERLSKKAIECFK